MPNDEYKQAISRARRAIKRARRENPLLDVGLSILEAYNAAQCPNDAPPVIRPPQLPPRARQLNPKPNKRATKKNDYVDAEIIED